MRSAIARALKTPRGVGMLAGWATIAAMAVVTLAFHVPYRWLPDGTPEWLAIVAGCVPGVLSGMFAGKVGDEFRRWAVLRDEYAAGQRDIERLERGDR